MKEQILPPLPRVGKLKLSSRDGRALCSITVTTEISAGDLDPLFMKCFEELRAYLTGEAHEINLPLDFSGLSSFQLQVMREMKKIPYGKMATYKDLARAMGSRAYRAIGSACGRNPFMLIYPCHRVVGTHGLGGFAHGLRMKKDLLALESGMGRFVESNCSHP